MHFAVKQLFELDVDNLNDPVVLVGWPGISLVGKLTISSIRKSIKAEKYLSIEYFDFPAKSIVKEGYLKIPAANVFYKSHKDNDIFILTAKFQPQSAEGVFDFSKTFCEEMDKLTQSKIKMYISAGALVSDKIENNPLIYVSSTDSDLINSFLKYKNTKLMKSGIIAGANGILPTWAGYKGFAPGVCLLAETLPPLPMMNIDPRASKALVSLLMAYFKLDMNFDELDKKIKEMESIFNDFKKQADFMMQPRDLEPGTDSYFR
ncbi:MAG: PAC2 family protein [Promethearchaeota archaeon]